MGVAPDGHRELSLEMRVVLVTFFALAGLAFIVLYLRSGHTNTEFAWTIKPELTAAFLGAGYGAGCVLIVASLREQVWAQVRVGVGIVLIFTAMILVATLLHLSRFHFGVGNTGIARFAAWVFLAVYVFAPTAGTWLFVREQRLAGTAPLTGPPLPGWFMVTVGAQGGLMAGFGAALFVAPWLFAVAWPWALTSLTAQAVGSWLVPIGLGNLAVLREGDLRRAQIPALTSVVYGALQLFAVARFRNQVQWHEPGSWIWLTILIVAIVTGGYVLLRNARTGVSNRDTLRAM